MKAIKVVLILIALGLIGPGSSFAALTLGVMPQQKGGEARGWYSYTLKPGDQITDTAIVNNLTAKDIDATVIGLDTELSTPEATLSTATQNKDLGSWIVVATPDISVPAGGEKPVNFSLTVPSNASVGEHTADVAVINKSSNKVVATTRVIVTIPGKVTLGLKWKKTSIDIREGKLFFDIQAENSSNVRVKPQLDIVQKGLFGTKRQTILSIGIYAPGETIHLQPLWQYPAPKLGFYRYELTLHTLTMKEVLEDGSTKPIPDQQIVTTHSLWTGTGLLLMLVCLLLLLWVAWRLQAYLHDRKKFVTQIDHYTVKKGESLMHIASEVGVHPKKLIKLNRLEWPYALSPGETLLIPGQRLDRESLFNKKQEEGMPGVLAYLLSTQTTLYHPTVKSKSSSKNVKKPSPKKSVRKSSIKKTRPTTRKQKRR